MNKFSKLLTLLVIAAMLVGCLASCNLFGGSDDTEPCTSHVDANSDGKCDVCNEAVEPDLPEWVDYAATLKFDPNSGRAHEAVTVRYYIDGDTTHFNVSSNVNNLGLLKARYLGINTPESTGAIEPWGKKASDYTKTQLKKAENITDGIIIESDDANWNVDSTGERYLVWVWYKTSEDGEYRNLNIEILQQGLAYGSNATDNSYSSYAMGALNQAYAYKLHVFSSEKDPDFYDGDAYEVTLRELKTNSEFYTNKLVRFQAVVAKSVGPTIYVEEYDPENDMYYGIQIYAGYGSPILDRFAIGNRVSIVGKLTYYETGGTYQISALEYRMLDSADPNYTYVVSTGHTPSFNEITIPELNSDVTIESWVEQENPTTGELEEVKVTKDYDYGMLALYSTVTLKNLTVTDLWTTVNEASESKGAITITCKDEQGNEIDIRTAKLLYKDVGGVSVEVTEADFPIGTVISVKGIIDYYEGEYQIKVFSINDFTYETAE